MKRTLRSFAILTTTVLPGGSAMSFAQDRTIPPGDTEVITMLACVALEAEYLPPAQATGSSAGEQLLLADPRSGAPAYRLTGVREAELKAQVGRRVQISGAVERPRTTPVLTTADGVRTGSVASQAPGATGITPDGAAAHEPSDAIGASIQAGAVADPAVADGGPPATVAALPRLNAASFRVAEGSCVTPRPAAPASKVAAAAEPPARGEPTRDRGTERLEVRGCLVRQTLEGTALTPQKGSLDRLVLTNAAIARDEPPRASGAVPGSPPSGRGSGTVPDTPGTTGRSERDPGAQSFLLDIPPAMSAELTKQVGQRVQIVGDVDVLSNRERPAAPVSGHTSAPERTIAVSAFRALGGGCQ